MSTVSRYNGHEIICVGEKWLYNDDKTPTYGNTRVCGNCGIPNKTEGFEEYDGCIGKLSGDVMNACCGHGNAQGAYVQFSDNSRISGEEALRFMKLNKEK
jgi:hypothetical protein